MQNSLKKIVALKGLLLGLGLLCTGPALAAEPVTDRERRAAPLAPELPASLRAPATRPASSEPQPAPVQAAQPAAAAPVRAPVAPPAAAEPVPPAAPPPSEDTATIVSRPADAAPAEPESAPLPEGLRVYYAPNATGLAENELAAVELLTRMANMGGQYAFQIFLNTPAQGDQRIANLRQFELQRVLRDLGVSASRVRFAYSPFFDQGSDEAAPLDSHYAELRLIEQN